MAVKRVINRPGQEGTKTMSDFRSEVTILCRLRHPNIGETPPPARAPRRFQRLRARVCVCVRAPQHGTRVCMRARAVLFMGVVLDPLCLVTEYCARGNLCARALERALPPAAAMCACVDGR